jgi:hypothetical protein
MWTSSVIFKTFALLKQPPNRQKFAQSGQPVLTRKLPLLCKDSERIQGDQMSAKLSKMWHNFFVSKLIHNLNCLKKWPKNFG